MKDDQRYFITPQQTVYHAQILSNRVHKRYDHLRKRFARQSIDCFRLYDWDIPEVRAVVDWYAGHIVVAEYERTQTGPDWLPAMAAAVGKVLNIPSEKIHIKRRRTKTEEGPRYKKMGTKGTRFVVNERELKFWINLDDFLDTGLYSDHRDTRVIIKELAKDKNFLNLFAYTGAFTCAAALGGARTTTTVDRSETYSKWTKDNLELNSLMGPQHTLIQSDVMGYLERAAREGKRFDLVFVDPPSFFRDQKKNVAFDISRDHPKLIREVLKVMAPGATVFFSTNHQRFEPKFYGLPVKNLTELTPKTIPEDFRNQKVHRCWRMEKI
jgi:23S rRNA G2069 N7-methylase RlmK/C1962 C5-methylase RlmI